MFGPFTFAIWIKTPDLFLSLKHNRAKKSIFLNKWSEICVLYPALANFKILQDSLVDLKTGAPFN